MPENVIEQGTTTVDQVVEEGLTKVSETPKSSHHIGELPNGVVDESGSVLKYIEFKEITGEEEDILATRKMPPQKRINKILENCVVKIGHITEKAEIKKLLTGMVFSDRLYAIVQVRIASLGKIYSFKIDCNDENCKNKFIANVDLEDIKWIGMKDPSKLQYTITIDGVKYNWNVMDGRREDRISSMNMERDLLSVGIYARLNTVNDMPVTMDMVKRWGQKLRMQLREEFRKYEPDIDDAVELECPACGNTWKESIEYGQASFFFPLEGSTSSKLI